jgi:Zn-finger nucleic acid-binding protein
MAELSCPICRTALEPAGYTQRCGRCDGAWIDEDTLVAMLQERTSTLVFLPWQPRAKDTERTCAACGTAMQTASLGSVALDRCAQHGVWFDAGELAALLAEAKQFRTDPKRTAPHSTHGHDHGGLLGALERLLGRG